MQKCSVQSPPLPVTWTYGRNSTVISIHRVLMVMSERPRCGAIFFFLSDLVPINVCMQIGPAKPGTFPSSTRYHLPLDPLSDREFLPAVGVIVWPASISAFCIRVLAHFWRLCPHSDWTWTIFWPQKCPHWDRTSHSIKQGPIMMRTWKITCCIIFGRHCMRKNKISQKFLEIVAKNITPIGGSPLFKSNTHTTHNWNSTLAELLIVKHNPSAAPRAGINILSQNV